MNIHHKTINLRNNCGYFIWRYTVSNYEHVGHCMSKLKTGVIRDGYSISYVLSETLQHIDCGSIMSNISSLVKIK